MGSPCHCSAVRLAARKLTSIYDEALAPFGLNIAQLALLRAVARSEPVSITALGRAQALDRSTIGRNVRVLQRMGAVEAVRSDEDQRESMVRLTGQGHALLSGAARSWDDCQRAVEARIGEARLATLRDILDAL